MVLEGRLRVLRYPISAVLFCLLAHKELLLGKMLVRTGMIHCNPHDTTKVQTAKALVNRLALIGRSAPTTDSL